MMSYYYAHPNDAKCIIDCVSIREFVVRENLGRMDCLSFVNSAIRPALHLGDALFSRLIQQS